MELGREHSSVTQEKTASCSYKREGLNLLRLSLMDYSIDVIAANYEGDGESLLLAV